MPNDLLPSRVPVQFTQAGVAVLEEGRNKKWGTGGPVKLGPDCYEVWLAPQLAKHFEDERARTGRTPSQVVIDAYIGRPAK